MGMALKNLSEAMNNTQALEITTIILGRSLTSEAIADQKIEPSRPCAELMTEDLVPSEALQADRKDQSSAPTLLQAEKWSSEAIAARSKTRPWRMEKLKMAGILSENPGLEFLQECWQNDPALQIVPEFDVNKKSKSE